MAPPAGRRASDRAWGVAYFAVSLPGIGLVNALPFLTGALIDGRGFSAPQAGLLVSAELIVAAVVAFACSSLRPGISLRALALTGCLCFALGNLVSMGAGSALLLTGRALAGLGGGMAIAAGGRTIARCGAPAMVAACATVALSGVAAIVAFGCGLLVLKSGYAGAVALLAVLGLMAAPLTVFIPAGSPLGDSSASAGRARDLDKLSAAALLLCPGLMFVASGSLWSFVERLGRHAGLSGEAIAQVTAATAFAGVAAALLSVLSAKFITDRAAATLGVLFCGASVTMLAAADAPLSYGLGLTLVSFAFVYVVPFLTSIAARLDPSGWLSSGVLASLPLAGSVGPLIGGLLLARESYGALPWFVAGLSVLALGALLLADAVGKPLSTLKQGGLR